ncbi:unnamed protein product [Albugo candida]|uniref:Uncharacterized protein n=1 Tax=Albugo candida TaxID=65357 RepID=A0A024G1P2_9STRA|nr:unnamed protein product [Albugo candida]|eukprot:CCI40575.1 unnamed protein product [Albugo candida]
MLLAALTQIALKAPNSYISPLCEKSGDDFSCMKTINRERIDSPLHSEGEVQFMLYKKRIKIVVVFALKAVREPPMKRNPHRNVEAYQSLQKSEKTITEPDSQKILSENEFTDPKMKWIILATRKQNTERERLHTAKRQEFSMTILAEQYGHCEVNGLQEGSEQGEQNRGHGVLYQMENYSQINSELNAFLEKKQLGLKYHVEEEDNFDEGHASTGEETEYCEPEYLESHRIIASKKNSSCTS